MLIITVSLLLLLVPAIGLAWSALNWVWLKPKKLEKKLWNLGFHGNPYKFLVGDTKELAKMLKEAKAGPIHFGDDIGPRVAPFHYQTINNYGRKSFLWFGPTPRIIITNPEHVRQILTNMDDFQKLPRDHRRGLIEGLAALEGTKWAKHRKILNPAFHVDKLKWMIPALYESCREMIGKWEGLILEKESLELDVWPDLQALTSDAISRTAFGSSYLEGRRIFQLLKQLAILTSEVQQSVYIPGSRFFPNKTTRKVQAIDKEVKDSIRAIIKKREEIKRANEFVEGDLLGILMQSNNKEIQEQGNNKDVGMSYEDMIKECKLFYFAGQETTSTLLVWTMILLAKHTYWQERAREEVLQVFGNNNLKFEVLNQLQTVTMILNESLRLYPPVVGQIRYVREEITLGGIKLPPGVQVILLTIMVHHDHEFWGDDALKFNPERFLEGVSKATNNQVSFFPFGWGPRICIGQKFALIEAKIAIAMILQRFSFELSPSYTHAPQTIVTLQPQYGAQLILQKL